MTQPVNPPPAPTGNRSGLVALSDGMRAFFVANSIPAVVTPVGWRYRTFNINEYKLPSGATAAGRVCLIPGKIDPTSPGPPKVLEAGRLTQPQLQTPGRLTGSGMGGPTSNVGNPRALRTFHKLVSLSVWAADTSDTSSDELQLAALENLLDWTVSAMHNAVDPVTGVPAGLGDIELQDAVWNTPPVERAFGRELVAYFELSGPIFDLPVQYTTPQPAIIKGPIT